MDPLLSIGRICQEQNLWLHVDAAMSGTAALCPEFRHLQHGLEQADSYSFNPHKWMFTNFDCNCLFVADREALIRSLTVLPEYLRNQATESGGLRLSRLADRAGPPLPFPQAVVCDPPLRY
jgi:aromatic-L-amino-acid decarboxylase